MAISPKDIGLSSEDFLLALLTEAPFNPDHALGREAAVQRIAEYTGCKNEADFIQRQQESRRFASQTESVTVESSRVDPEVAKCYLALAKAIRIIFEYPKNPETGEHIYDIQRAAEGAPGITDRETYEKIQKQQFVNGNEDNHQTLSVIANSLLPLDYEPIISLTKEQANDPRNLVLTYALEVLHDIGEASPSDAKSELKDAIGKFPPLQQRHYATKRRNADISADVEIKVGNDSPHLSNEALKKKAEAEAFFRHVGDGANFLSALEKVKIVKLGLGLPVTRHC